MMDIWITIDDQDILSTDGKIYDNIPSGYVKIAIENDHRNSGFSH